MRLALPLHDAMAEGRSMSVDLATDLAFVDP
jgi:hypothetical protein